MRKLLRWFLGLKVCDNCGVVAVYEGKHYFTAFGRQTFVYHCERCSNPKFLIQEIEQAKLAATKENKQ